MEGFFDERDILQSQLVVDDLDISDGVDLALDVGDVFILEQTQHVEDSIAAGDVREESISETLTFVSALDESGNVDDVQISGNLRLWLVILAQHIESRDFHYLVKMPGILTCNLEQ